MRLTGDRCRCATCLEYFNSSAAFDKHRIGRFDPPERRCRSVEEMAAAGMVRNARGYWVTHKNRFLAFRESISATIEPTPGTGSPSGQYPRASAPPEHPDDART